MFNTIKEYNTKILRNILYRYPRPWKIYVVLDYNRLSFEYIFIQKTENGYVLNYFNLKMYLIDWVKRREKYGAEPPPIVVQSDDPNIQPILWRRRLNSRELKDYRGGWGPVKGELIQPENDTLRWILAYLLKPLAAQRYLTKIREDGATYPEIVRRLIDETSNPQQLVNFYWDRQYRPERGYLINLLEQLTQADLYLMPSNLFDRHPARKLLSYYDGAKNRQSLDRMATAPLIRFGYLTPINPTRLIYHPPYGGESYSVDPLDPTLPPLARLRLGIYIQASAPWLQDLAAWAPFLDRLDQDAQILTKSYLQARANGESTPDLQITSEDGLCLVCRQIRPDGDFALCGHPICLLCQAALKSAKCPFCQEHFVADNIDNEFLDQVTRGPPIDDLYERIEGIKIQAVKRRFKFDWANREVRLFSVNR